MVMCYLLPPVQSWATSLRSMVRASDMASHASGLGQLASLVCPVTPLPRLQAPVSTLGTSGQPQPISSSPLPSKAGVTVPIFTELETEAQRG